MTYPNWFILNDKLQSHLSFNKIETMSFHKSLEDVEEHIKKLLYVEEITKDLFDLFVVHYFNKILFDYENLNVEKALIRFNQFLISKEKEFNILLDKKAVNFDNFNFTEEEDLLNLSIKYKFIIPSDLKKTKLDISLDNLSNILNKMKDC